MTALKEYATNTCTEPNLKPGHNTRKAMREETCTEICNENSTEPNLKPGHNTRKVMREETCTEICNENR